MIQERTSQEMSFGKSAYQTGRGCFPTKPSKNRLRSVSLGGFLRPSVREGS
jgi:hypothetical protein